MGHFNKCFLVCDFYSLSHSWRTHTLQMILPVCLLVVVLLLAALFLFRLSVFKRYSRLFLLRLSLNYVGYGWCCCWCCYCMHMSMIYLCIFALLPFAYYFISNALRHETSWRIVSLLFQQIYIAYARLAFVLVLFLFFYLKSLDLFQLEFKAIVLFRTLFTQTFIPIFILFIPVLNFKSFYLKKFVHLLLLPLESS